MDGPSFSFLPSFLPSLLYFPRSEEVSLSTKKTNYMTTNGAWLILCVSVENLRVNSTLGDNQSGMGGGGAMKAFF